MKHQNETGGGGGFWVLLLIVALICVFLYNMVGAK